MDQRLNIVTLGVADLTSAREFYARLGWKEAAASNDNIAFFQLNGSALALFQRDALRNDANLAGGPDPNPGGVTLAITFASKQDVDRAMDTAIEAGGTLLKSPQDVFWGGYSGYFADPDGHPWELAWNPFADLDNDGNLRL